MGDDFYNLKIKLPQKRQKCADFVPLAKSFWFITVKKWNGLPISTHQRIKHTKMGQKTELIKFLLILYTF